MFKQRLICEKIDVIETNDDDDDDDNKTTQHKP